SAMCVVSLGAFDDFGALGRPPVCRVFAPRRVPKTGAALAGTPFIDAVKQADGTGTEWENEPVPIEDAHCVQINGTVILRPLNSSSSRLAASRRKERSQGHVNAQLRQTVPTG